ncbi:Insulinase (Peptidase M16), partial [Dinochytrium kinnereticum]
MGYILTENLQGTEKYPVENDYSQFLNEVGGGYSNAFTSSENTNFFFEVASEGEAFEGALDRFAQFFIAPLFDESCTERELKAVDSEHKKNIQDDCWRISQLEKDLSSANHPYRKFGTGCWQTLHELPLMNGLDIRKILLEFHDRYYSANIMKLVILGKEPLDVLSDWVVAKFSSVHNKSIAVPSFPGNPLTEKELKKIIRVKPVKDMQSLELAFPFPDTIPYYRKSPDSYLAHLIGHEAPGSILAVLRAKGWANGLSSSVAHAGKHFDFFKVSVELTDDGMEHWQSIVILIFQYIEMLRRCGVQEWIYNECKTMAQLTFRFQEKFSPSDFTSWASQNMQSYAKADILSGYSLMEEFDEELIRNLLDLLKPDRFRVMLVSTIHESETWEKAPWYGTEYIVEDLPVSLLETLAHPPIHDELHLPERNPYIPSVFKVISPAIAEDFTPPTIIEDTPLSRLWYKLDQTYKGFELRVAGYTDKIAVLLEKVVHTIRNLQIVPERFSAIKEETVRNYKNFDNENPDHHASYFMNWILQEKLWTNSEKLQEIQSTEAKEVSQFAMLALQQLHIEGCVMGTVTEQEAISYLKIVERGLSLPDAPLRPLPITLRFNLLRTHIVPYPTAYPCHTPLPFDAKSGTIKRSFNLHSCSLGAVEVLKESQRTIVGYTYRRLLPNHDNVNNALEYYLQIGDASNTGIRARLLLLDQLASEPCFDQLRTKEQLGYVVWCGIRSTIFDWGFRFMVQSERDPAFVEERIEKFIVKLRDIISDMSEEEYARNVETLSAKLLQTDKNQNEAFERIWTAIKYSGYQFYQGRKDAINVRSVTKQDLLAFFDERVARGSPLRRKLSVQIWSDHSKNEFTGRGGMAVNRGEAESNGVVNGDAGDQAAPVQSKEKDEVAETDVDSSVTDGSVHGEIDEGALDAKQDRATPGAGPVMMDLIFETDEAVSELKGSWLLSRGVVPTSAHSHLAKA